MVYQKKGSRTFRSVVKRNNEDMSTPLMEEFIIPYILFYQLVSPKPDEVCPGIVIESESSEESSESSSSESEEEKEPKPPIKHVQAKHKVSVLKKLNEKVTTKKKKKKVGKKKVKKV
jgi:hypothetical protein